MRVSGVGSVIVGAIGAYFKTSLPYWTFWMLALVCFFIASFRAWRDVSIGLQSARSELNQLRTPKYAKEQLELVRSLYGKLDEHEKALLKELRLRGAMLEPQATEFRQKRTGIRTIGPKFILMKPNRSLTCVTSVVFFSWSTIAPTSRGFSARLCI